MRCSLTHDMRDNYPRVIATWQSLGDYLTDVQECYAALPVSLRHDKPAIQKILLPDSNVTAKLEKFRTNLDVTEFVKSTKLTQTIGEGTLDIGLYLSGTPECFIKTEKIHGKDIRMVFSPEVLITSKPDALYLRGAAVLSLIDSLESQGHRVELWMGWDNTVEAKIYESRILVKRACDYTTPQQLAGPCCDSDFLRTCEFNMIAHFLTTFGVGHNAGLSLTGDITMSGNYKDMKHFDSIESTLTWIESMKAKLTSRDKKSLQG